MQLFVPTEVAHDTVAELGELGNVQFKDVSETFGVAVQSWLILVSIDEPQRQPLPTLFHWRNSSCR